MMLLAWLVGWLFGYLVGMYDRAVFVLSVGPLVLHSTAVSCVMFVCVCDGFLRYRYCGCGGDGTGIFLPFFIVAFGVTVLIVL